MEQLAKEGAEKLLVWVVVEVVLTATLPAVPTLLQLKVMVDPPAEIENGGLEAGNCACILATRSEETAAAVLSWPVPLP